MPSSAGSLPTEGERGEPPLREVGDGTGPGTTETPPGKEAEVQPAAASQARGRPVQQAGSDFGPGRDGGGEGGGISNPSDSF